MISIKQKYTYFFKLFLNFSQIFLHISLEKSNFNSGKVIFVGSMAGKIARIKSEDIKNKLRNENISRQELFEIISDFIQGVKEGNYEERG